jgi:CheY-like chemotaxis protein
VAQKKVLVVDDDYGIRQLICTVVKREGVEVDCVSDGAEAIEMLGQNDYFLILLDLMMPKVDGFGVIEHISRMQLDRPPVVIVLTAYADDMFKRVDSSVVSGIIRKPFDIQELASLLHESAKQSDRMTREALEHDRLATALKLPEQRRNSRGH